MWLMATGQHLSRPTLFLRNKPVPPNKILSDIIDYIPSILTIPSKYKDINLMLLKFI